MTSISYASSQLAFPRTLPAPEDDARVRDALRRLLSTAWRMDSIAIIDDAVRDRAGTNADVPLTTRLQSITALPVVITHDRYTF